MKFHEVIKNIIHKSKPENPLSRLFGFQRDVSGKMQIVESEAIIIKSVIEVLASRSSDSTEKVLEDILQQFFIDGIRNRSGKRWTHQSLLGLVRPIYCGMAVSRYGIWRRSKIYPPIIDASQVKAALKHLKYQKMS